MSLITINSLNLIQDGRLLSSSVIRRRHLSRCIAALSGIALGTVSSVALCLGLGDIQSTSFIGQPLKANIELVSLDGDIDVSSLLVRQVPAQEAQALGVDILYTANRFEVVIDKSGGTPKISVVSKEPVNEPYVNLLVELRWPNGVVYREYPLLLDPPPSAPVIASKTTRSKPLETKPVTASKPVKASSSERRTPTVAAPKQVKLKPLATADGKYRVKPGDTLSKIAQRWREGTNHGIHDTMQWLYENNLNAFANQNIDLLRAGVSLRMPDLSAYRLNNEVPEENTPQQSAKEVGDEAETLPSTDSYEKQSDQSKAGIDAVVSEDSKGLLTVSTVTQDDKTRELIDMLVRENESLRARMEKVESSEYLDTLKQLIVLQRQQISDLRSRVGVSDSGASKEMDALLQRIGIADSSGKTPKRAVEAVISGDALADEDKNLRAKLELASENVAAKKADESELAVIKVAPVLSQPLLASREEKGLLIWLVLGGGAALLAIFTGLFIYYRKLTTPPEDFEEEVDEEDSELFPAFDDESSPGSSVTSLASASAQPQPALKSRAPSVQDEASIDPELDFPGNFSGGYRAGATADEDSWLGESAELTEADIMDMDAAMREVQEAFDDLLLDESALDELDKAVSMENSLEALTVELPKKTERRPDDEVKMSIAEKMAMYNPEEYRQEMESLSLLDLDDLTELEEQQDEVDTAIYRAMMFCEFKKFSKARDLIAAKLDESNDARLVAAMEQIKTIELDLKKQSKEVG